MGPQEVADAAGEAGLDTENLDADSPRVTLGSAAYSPLAMASAYGTFAERGRARRALHRCSKVDRRRAAACCTRPRSSRREGLPGRHRQRGDLRPGAGGDRHGTGAYATNLGRPAAGKTGNHEGLTAWFIGYTPQLVTAVAFHRELGGDPLAPLNGVAYQAVFTGAGYPTSIWTAYMTAALDGRARCSRFPGRPIPTPARRQSRRSRARPPRRTANRLRRRRRATPSPSKTTTKPTPTTTSATPSPRATRRRRWRTTPSRERLRLTGATAGRARHNGPRADL